MTDKTPKLQLVSNDGLHFALYIDGKEVKGVNRLTINCEQGYFVTHEIEFLTVASGDGMPDKFNGV
ncbi:hypothetical protein PZE06_21860 [Robertmurraya sp. DFI.2.37]|uniref:hypothetical protein n=1 Tax=Robertmurraya sp. DFI.2.37 TaxID=3031819 RepID=UPI001245E590|nr:hypothetical protein [Robertmurraya sp. DFI.2.37]MDF1510784.1 hypothetical protein [Robertmurraya sp. DFI.2.37]